MKRIVLILIFFLLSVSYLKAQQPDQVLNQWSERTPIEKVYLHLDRDNYVAGETIWFKAYLYSDYFPDTISTSLYVELMDRSSAILSRKSLPVVYSSTYGQIEVPDSLSSGNYFIRAYTTTMLNLDTAFLFRRSVFISAKKNMAAFTIQDKSMRIEFFPEGGNFVKGLMNTIAFKASDLAGMPVEVKGVIMNDKNEKISAFGSIHDGMGTIYLYPMEKESFYAMLDGDGSPKKYPLPLPADKGVVFRLIPDPNGIHFELAQNTSDPMQRAGYMIGQMQHHVVFRLAFAEGKDQISGVIKTSKLGSGILQVTVFNKDGIPLAERLSFIDNKEYVQKIELSADSIDIANRARNVFSIRLDDSVHASLSVSITDPEYSLSDRREENIYSSLLLTSDLKGYIHDPAWYFLSNDDSVKSALDLVMMINGWRRFKWVDILKSLPPGNYKDGRYISLGGKLSLSGTNRPFANLPFIAFVSSPDSTKSLQLSFTDPQGYFKIDSLVFFEKSRVLFKDVRGKKSLDLDAKMGADSLMRPFRLPGLPMIPYRFNDSSANTKLARLALDWDAITRANGLMLQGITVKSRKKNPVQELEDKYESGLFTGFSEKAIDLVHSGQTIYQATIFEYLATIIPGLSVIRDGLDYSVYYRQGVTASQMGAIPMTIYLDEFPVDASIIATIPPNDIALVKVFNSFVGAAGGGPGGTLAIYLRKGSDVFSSSISDNQISYSGYSIIKEFYAPDYSIDKKKGDRADNRITLDWIPNIVAAGGSIRIPITFYNNDRTRQFRIVVEGMTTDGKMIFIEKKIPAVLSKRGF